MAYINNVVLLPRLEYRLQHCILSQGNCEKLQSPILMLIKNKAGMMHTTPNATMTHSNIVRVKSMWQNQLAHHFTKITARLNNKEDLGQAVWMRLKQAQLSCKSTTCVLSQEVERLENCKVKINLALKVIIEAKKLNISFRSEELEKSCRIEETGAEIASMLKEKDLQAFVKEKKLHLFLLEQTLDAKGERMLSWKQIR